MSRKIIDKEAMIADWKTGRFNVRDLAAAHGCGKTKASEIVKGIPKQNGQITDELVNVNHKLNQLSDKEYLSVRQVSLREEKIKERYSTLANLLFDRAGLLALNANENGIKTLAEAGDKILISEGLAQRHPNSTTINNAAQVANSQSITTSMTDEELERIIEGG